MKQALATVSLLVPSYEAGLSFYVDALGFRLVEDTALGSGKRWVTVAPPGGGGARLLLTEPGSPEQAAAIGRQAGGRVFLFLETDDFQRDHRRYLAAGVAFLEAPRHEAYGTVAVFQDPFGNKWDLLQPAHKGSPSA
ncbi:VOC family protein [Aestuariivirga litoralis]|uniref:VOC family protein n=1 Tax=Aestuariivirga litoralis TaxID=2650924 RepID=A0A2W2BHM6_9HYPH|nr:VOC family protein [Aestuariivirga litoralis]PZF75417.1 VOC family protein [Aestuariivirga litoralis]